MWSWHRILTATSARHKSLLLGGVIVVALGLVGFGSGALARTAKQVPVATPTTTLDVRGGEGPSEPQTPTVVTVKPGKKKPKKMTDEPGFTLYVFSADEKRKSKCNGECAAHWHPVVSMGGKPQAGPDVLPPEIGSILRDDGSFQVTFNDAPLYYYEDDVRPGDENGADRDEYGGTWSPEPPRDKKPKK
jgi:predicted lipoprotein with Yx(FWY)xxD motif